MSLLKVTYAKLHEAAHAPSVGDLGTTLPPNLKTLEGLDMEVNELGLHLKFSYKRIKTQMLIPMANIKNMVVVEQK